MPFMAMSFSAVTILHLPLQVTIIPYQVFTILIQHFYKGGKSNILKSDCVLTTNVDLQNGVSRIGSFPFF